MSTVGITQEWRIGRGSRALESTPLHPQDDPKCVAKDNLGPPNGLPGAGQLRVHLARARKRRFAGKFVDTVGDDRPIATALTAAIVSPVFAVLAARLTKPHQPLRRTVAVSTISYGIIFAFAYSGGGALAGSSFS